MAVAGRGPSGSFGLLRWIPFCNGMTNVYALPRKSLSMWSLHSNRARAFLVDMPCFPLITKAFLGPHYVKTGIQGVLLQSQTMSSAPFATATDKSVDSSLSFAFPFASGRIAAIQERGMAACAGI